MKHKQHISLLVIPSWYPPRGGAFFREHSRALAGAGMRVHVLAPVESGLRDHPMAFLTPGHFKMDRWEGGIGEEVQISRRIPLLKQENVMRWTRKACRMYEDYVRRHGHPDLVQVHSSMWGGLAAAQIREQWGTTYVITEHRGRFTESVQSQGSLVSPWHLPLLKRAFDQATHIITVSRALQTGILSICPEAAEKMSVIPNMCDTDFFSPPPDKETEKSSKAEFPAPSEKARETDTPGSRGVFAPRDKGTGKTRDGGTYQPPPDKETEKDPFGKQARGRKDFVFLCVASLENIKGVDVLLEAFAKLKRKSGNSRQLVITGGGPLERRLKALCRSLRIREEVRFTGNLDRDALLRQYQAADAFVLPSRMEAFGIVLIEAMACGLPVVATQSGGPAEIVTPECGLLVPQNDPEALAEGMDQMQREHRKYDRRGIVQWTNRHYAREVIANQYHKLYKKLVG